LLLVLVLMLVLALLCGGGGCRGERVHVWTEVGIAGI
jgi:hypothetical protein